MRPGFEHRRLRVPWVRAAVCAACAAFAAPFAVGSVGAATGVDTVRELTVDEDFAVLVEAVAARDPARIEAALDLFLRHPRGAVLVVLQRVPAARQADEAASAALEALARAGIADDCALAVALARPGLEDVLARAVEAIARRDPRTLGALESVARSAPSHARAALVRGVEKVGTRAAAAWLARCAEMHLDVRAEAVARLGRLGELLPLPISEDSLAVVRELAFDARSGARREAVVAAGRLRDDDAVPALLDALRAEDRGLVTDAAWALARITGLELRDRSERWEAWYADEEAWWRDRSDAAFARLDSIDPGENVAALIEISGRRAGRGRLAARIAPQLEAGDAVVAATAARVLGQLGSKVATAELVRALELGDPLASAAAWQALRQVTGKDLPHDPAAWRAAIAP